MTQMLFLQSKTTHPANDSDDLMTIADIIADLKSTYRWDKHDIDNWLVQIGVKQ